MQLTQGITWFLGFDGILHGWLQLDFSGRSFGGVNGTSSGVVFCLF
jgi:hypothetical protein